MTLIQEASALMAEQPESNIRIIIDLLHAMDQSGLNSKKMDDTTKRIGVAKGKIILPEGFDEEFDSLDSEIAEMFYGGVQ